MFSDVSFSESSLWVASNHETSNKNKMSFFYPLVLVVVVVVAMLMIYKRRKGKYVSAARRNAYIFSAIGIFVLIYVHVALFSMGSYESIKQCRESQHKSKAPCQASYPCVVFYNRLPKAGSTSVLSWMKDRIKETGMARTIHSTILKYRYLSPSDQVSFVQFWSSLFDQGTRTIFDRHMFYLNTSQISTSVPSPVYINMVRDPIDRCLSRYQYERRIGRIPDVSLDECVSTGSCTNLFSAKDTIRPIWYDRSTEDSFQIIREECNNYMTQWFCGMSPDCEYPPSTNTLEMAKKHVAHEYLYVGLMEDMHNSLKMMQYLLPDFFGFDRNWGDPEENTSEREATSAETLRLITNANELDLELYNYIKRIHRIRVRECSSPH